MSFENKRIIFTRPDGGVSVIIPAPGVPESRWMQDIPADAINPTEVTVADLPQDRTFRGAWKQDGRKCVEDVAKCKEISHEHRRAVRAEEFAPLDAAIASQIPGTDPAAVEAQRQAIRDKHAKAQADIDAAKTPAQLKAVLEVL